MILDICSRRLKLAMEELKKENVANLMATITGSSKGNHREVIKTIEKLGML